MSALRGAQVHNPFVCAVPTTTPTKPGRAKEKPQMEAFRLSGTDTLLRPQTAQVRYYGTHLARRHVVDARGIQTVVDGGRES